MVKKNDIVAIRETCTTRFVHGSRPSETRDVWRLAQCVSASRDGKTAKAIRYRKSGVFKVDQSPSYEVLHIEGSNQERARRLWETLDETTPWSSAAELRAAILGA